MPDPRMPARMPPRVEAELRSVLRWRDRPNPIDLYSAIRDVLLEREKDEGASGEASEAWPRQ